MEDADIGEDLAVVRPSGVAQVDGAIRAIDLVELGEEESSQVDGTSPGDGLDGAGALPRPAPGEDAPRISSAALAGK